jgi:hypothetical protein
MRVVRCAVVGALLLTACPLRVRGWQTQPQPLTNPAADETRAIPQSIDPAVAQQAKLLRIQRQKQLSSDSDKLLKLATDLKQQIDNATPDTLPADSVKKAAEIEKLAHSLRQRLKN